MWRSLFVATTAVALTLSSADAQVVDFSKYPNLKGQWNRFIVRGLPGQPSFDQTKPWGFGQEAPLTPEAAATLRASIADQANGGLGNSVEHARCSAAGMPFMMVAFQPLEFVVLPETTYILIADYDPLRRIFTDGRDWPTEITPTFQGYSIGRWIDSLGNGRYDTLEVETRGFKGPRIYDISGLPLHDDNQSIFRERFHLDKDDPNLLHDEITVIDHALTRPWTVDKRYVRNGDRLANWPEVDCPEYNAWVFTGRENYYLSADGYLMPTHKGQAPPDLRYFEKPKK
ncbi:MAG TPA: hypothetical protein VKW08_24990 [Xanthobacteraceae bacterium]|nr:hypothetical protein [Xanthobacteraceae bacterium]